MKIKFIVAHEIQRYELGIFSFNSYVYYLTLISSTRAFNLLARAFYLWTCAFTLPTRAFNLATRAFGVLTCGFKLVTRGFELVTRRFEHLSCGFEIVTRGFQLVTRVLLMKNFCFPSHFYSNVYVKFFTKEVKPFCCWAQSNICISNLFVMEAWKYL